MTTYTINNELNGIELIFDKKPASDILTNIKSAGFRWQKVKKLWYAKKTAERIALAEKIAGGAIADVKEVKENNMNISFFDRCSVADIPEHSKRLSTKEIAAETRNHIKKRFPEIKFSCRIGSGGWAAHNEVNFYFKSAPFSKDSVYFEFVRKYVEAWLWSYNYDNSDSMTDYFNRGFYENISTWEFVEVEPTEEQKKDLEDFDERKAKADKEAEEKAEAEFQKYMKEQEKARKEAEKREEENKKKHERIMKNAVVKTLEEEKKYIVSGAMICGIGKECSLSEVTEYGTEKEETALIKREVHFTEKEDYKDFCEMFMYDFDFLSGCGGTGTFDERVTSDNFTKLNQSQRESVKWVLWDCVAVYFNNVLMLIIDPEGYNYSRYINIVTDYTKTKASEVEKSEAEEEKTSFYFPEKIENQAETIKAGEDYTIISIDPWTMSASMRHITTTRTKIEKYAQFEKALYIDYVEKGKRKELRDIWHEGNSVLIYRGHLAPVPEDLTKRKISNNMYEVLTAGSSASNFLVNVYNYYKDCGILPLVNTLQF